MKQWLRCLVLFILIISLSTITLGAETQSKGSVRVLVGDESTAQFNSHISDKLDLTGEYENDDEIIRAGVDYDFSDRFGVKAGVQYDFDLESAVGYGGFDFSLPFATNLHLNGFYDYNYKGKKWGRYETVIRIEMYPNHYLDAGVMGNRGSGAEVYDYNPENEALLFMRGDFNWSVKKKFGIELRPVILVKGEYFHDYDITYQANERLKVVLNMNNLWDKDIKYQIGLEYKF